MTKFWYLLLGILLSAGSATFAKELPHRYTSPYSDLVYAFDTSEGLRDGTVTRFRIATTAGDLEGVIEDARPLAQRVTLTVGATDKMVATVTQRKDVGTFDVHLRSTSLGEVYYTAQVGGFGLMTARAGSGCEDYPASPIFAALAQAHKQLTADFNRQPNAFPSHLAQVATAVDLVKSLPNQIPECRDRVGPFTGWCQGRSYAECIACCNDADFETLACGLVGATLCAEFGFLCSASGILGCYGALAFGIETCVDLECRGGTGDPSCPASRECPADHCWGCFCPIGCGTECGACQGSGNCGQEHPVCCGCVNPY